MNPPNPSMSDSPSWGPRPRILLLGSGDRSNIIPEAERLRPIIEQHADIVHTDLTFRDDLSKSEADFAVVLGGDGSILRAANQMQTRQIPVLGVNLGKLGFLAGLLPDEFEKLLPEVASCECHVVNHLMFQCQLMRAGKTLFEELGLNEVAVLGGPPFSILDVDLYVDSELATTYSCDGLIVSTPIGSTAHSLSAGGPILRKNLQAFVISPISPHTLTVRPVVDTADRVYEIVIKQPNAGTSVVVDGRVMCCFEENDRLRVTRAEPKFKLVEVRGHNYYRTLREKLGWGGSITNQRNS